MAIVVHCGCGRQIHAGDEQAGRRAKCPDCGRELAVPNHGEAPLDFKAPEYGPTAPRAPKSAHDPDFDDPLFDKGADRTSRVAVASLVLGVLSFIPCLGLLTFIPAITLGILVLNSIGKGRGQVKGKGLALGGIATGVIGSMVAVIGMFAWSLHLREVVREDARRALCAFYLKEIGRGLHRFESDNNRFPGRAIVDAEGKPLLSWRVAILPYIEQKPLYDRFHLDEPWDSPHNKALIAEMPSIYSCPIEWRAATPTWMTIYRGLTGPGTFFEGDEGTKVGSFTDGLSQTLAVVESSQPVTWTQPDELAFDPNSPALPPMGSHHPGGFNALLGDGSVIFIKLSFSQDSLRVMITRDDGKSVNRDAY